MGRPVLLAVDIAVNIAVIVAVVAWFTACGGPATHDGTGVVTAVVDGDTIDVRIAGRDERVRLIGIDTPEVARSGSPAECHGAAASAFTRSLLPTGTRVRIERDIVGRDHFGRLLGYVHLVDAGTAPPHDDHADPIADRVTDPSTDRAPDWGSRAGSDERFVNLAIVEHGHATPFAIEPNRRHAHRFAAAAARAEARDLGLWGRCNQVASPR